MSNIIVRCLLERAQLHQVVVGNSDVASLLGPDSKEASTKTRTFQLQRRPFRAQQADACFGTLRSSFPHRRLLGLPPVPLPHQRNQRASSIAMASAMELPRELWLEIVSHLDYFDLKRCMSVSKTFKMFTEIAALDDTLFRSEAVIPAGGTINPDEICLHPAFDRMNYGCGNSIDQVWFYVDDYKTQLLLTDTVAAKEQATNPPVNVLRLQVHSWPTFEVKNKTGVTVVQVLKALCRFFAKGDRRERMGDHIVWNGWDFKVLDGSGHLLLQAMMFDS